MNIQKKIYLFDRVSSQEKLFLTKHLAVMLKSGIPLSEALDILSLQTKSHKLQDVLQEIHKDVLNGKSLHTSMEKHTDIFDSFYRNLIEIGEETGALEENLQFLSEQLTKDFNLKKKVRGALLYPALVLTATLLLGGFISLVVLPQLVGFFDAFDAELPLTTRILLGFAQLMQSYGIVIVGSIIGFFVAGLFLIRTSVMRPYWHAFILKIPLFGKLLKYNQISHLSRNLGIMLKSGVPITSGIEATIDAVGNAQYAKALKDIHVGVRKGNDISSILEKYTDSLFPLTVTKMVQVGEKTGSLEQTFLYLGDFYEEEIDNVSKNLTTVLEPILLIGIGLIVGFVALAIIGPIYELTGSLRR